MRYNTHNLDITRHNKFLHITLIIQVFTYNQIINPNNKTSHRYLTSQRVGQHRHVFTVAFTAGFTVFTPPPPVCSHRGSTGGCACAWERGRCCQSRWRCCRWWMRWTRTHTKTPCLVGVAPQLRGPESPVLQPKDQVFWNTKLLDIELNGFLLPQIGVHGVYYHASRGQACS